MNMKWHKAVGGIAVTMVLAGGSSMSYAADMDYRTWDANKSGTLEYNEWDTGFDNNGLFTTWDTDKDGSLSDEEYGQGVYNSYDRDKSGDWNEDEYNSFRDDAGEKGWLDM